MLEEYQNNGVNIPPQIFRRVNKGSFRKVVDSKVYVIDREVSTILSLFCSLDHQKPELKRSRRRQTMAHPMPGLKPIKQDPSHSQQVLEPQTLEHFRPIDRARHLHQEDQQQKSLRGHKLRLLDPRRQTKRHPPPQRIQFQLRFKREQGIFSDEINSHWYRQQDCKIRG